MDPEINDFELDQLPEKDKGHENGCNSNEEIIRDDYFLSFALFYVIGSLSFLPIFFNNTANDFWMYKFRDVNETTSTRNDYQKTFIAYCATAMQLASCSSPFWYYVSKKTSPNLRMYTSFILYFFSFLISLIVTQIDTESYQRELYYGMLGVTAVISVTIQLFVTTLIELSSRFPEKYIGIIFGSTALTTTLVALVQILSLEIGTSSNSSTFIYFLVALVYVICAALFYFRISKKNIFFKHHANKENEAEEKFSSKIVLQITWKIKFHLLILFVSSYSSAIVHPGITSLVQSNHKGDGSRWGDVYFVPVIVFLLNGIASIVGKFIAISIVDKIANMYVLLGLTIAKIVLVPLIMLCDLEPRKHLPIVFKEDYYVAIFNVLLAGLTMVIMIVCAVLLQRIPKPEERYLMNIIVLFILNFSMSVFSFGNILLVNAL